MQTTAVRAMVSQTVGWASVFCAVPGGKNESGEGVGQNNTLCWGEEHRAPERLTHKAELVREHPEEAVTMHGEEDGKIGSQAAPDEEVVDGCPESCV